MQKSTKLILAIALVCFAIMTINSNCVLADDAVELKILKKVKKLIIKVDREVLPRLGSVPKTGQTTSYAPDDDGDLQKGKPWPSPRFTDNGNGTVTDNLTGLIWLKDANCFGAETWVDALADCNGLATANCGLTDGSAVGDWRLPNVRELHSLIDYGNYDLALPNDHPFDYVMSGVYWSGTTHEIGSSIAWYVSTVSGYVYADSKSQTYRVWPVRGPN